MKIRTKQRELDNKVGLASDEANEEEYEILDANA